METESQKSEPRWKRAWGILAAWIGGITAVFAFVGTVTGAFNNIRDRLHRTSTLDAKIAFAKQQAGQGEYSAALQTYAIILQSDPSYRPAQQAQLATAEEWLRSFHISAAEGADLKALAAGYLDQIFPVLDTALTHVQGAAAADVLAHLGWAHWMNRYIAMREFGPTAEQDFRKALSLDPQNVYAHGMLGNWLLVNHKSLPEALQHFSAAEATGKDRAFVRRFELGALVHDEEPGARAAVMKIAHSMMQNGESLDAERKSNTWNYCCNPGSTSRTDRLESFSALPSADAMQTYMWLDADTQGDAQAQSLRRQFTQALITELAGDRDAASKQLRELHVTLEKVKGTTLDEQVQEEIQQLKK